MKFFRVALACVLALGLASCAQPLDKADPVNHTKATKPTAADSLPASIQIKATSSSLENLNPDDSLTIDVEHAKSTEVKVTDSAGVELPGTLTDGIWQPDGNFAPRQTYQIQVSAEGDDGKPAEAQASATTPNPEMVVEVDFLHTDNPGSGMPIWVRFDLPVKDQAQRKAIMDASHVTTTPVQEGSWGWMDEHTLYWRPKTYWEPNSTAHVDVNAAGMPVGDTWVLKNVSADYQFGDQHVMKADINAHTLSAYTNGQLVQTFPASFGKPGDETMTGTKIVMEKQPQVVMDSGTFGVPADSAGGYRTDVFLAQRLTWSGEYIHAAPWADNSHGNSNVSHGCTGLSDANAQWFYDWTRVGDPIEFTGDTPQVPAWDTYGAWSFTWEQWQQYSDATLAAPIAA